MCRDNRGNTYHEVCFTCTSCRSALRDEIYWSSDKLVCRGCSDQGGLSSGERSSLRCAGCGDVLGNEVRKIDASLRLQKLTKMFFGGCGFSTVRELSSTVLPVFQVRQFDQGSVFAGPERYVVAHIFFSHTESADRTSVFLTTRPVLYQVLPLMLCCLVNNADNFACFYLMAGEADLVRSRFRRCSSTYAVGSNLDPRLELADLPPRRTAPRSRSRPRSGVGDLKVRSLPTEALRERARRLGGSRATEPLRERLVC
jgi:LIM domain